MLARPAARAGARIAWRGAADAAGWQAIWSACRWATYFQSRAWAEVWHEAAGLRPAAHLVRFADGVRALLPACAAPLARGLFLRRVMPAGSLGGWIADRPLGAAHLRILAAETERLGDLELRLAPFAPFPAAASAGERLLRARDATAAVDLARGFEAVRRGFSKGHRAAVRQAERAGVEIVRAGRFEDWRTYASLYEATLARWGARAQGRHPRALFHVLAARRDPRVSLWLARHEGRAVAGAICLAGPRHVAYWHGAALEEAFGVRPVHALLHEAMGAACDAGARWFDLGPSGGLDGVLRFKRGFGARELAFPVLRRHTWRARAAGRAGRLWRGTLAAAVR